MWLSYLCKVRCSFACNIYSHSLQGDLHAWPVFAWRILWDAGIWVEEKKPSKHEVFLVWRAKEGPEENPYWDLQVYQLQSLWRANRWVSCKLYNVTWGDLLHAHMAGVNICHSSAGLPALFYGRLMDSFRLFSMCHTMACWQLVINLSLSVCWPFCYFVT